MCSMLEVNVKPKVEVDINPMLGFNINLILFPTKIPVCHILEIDVNTEFWLQPDFHF